MKIMGLSKQKPERLVLYIIIPIIIILCIGLAFLLSLDKASVRVHSQNGIWDLSNSDVKSKGVQIEGNVEYIPNELLTPDEYDKKKNKAILSDEPLTSEFATSRIILKMPDDGWYAFTRTSADYSEKVYVNGKLMANMGTPGADKNTTTSEVGRITFTAQATGGTIEIVQQSANFVHRHGGSHGDWYVGGNWLLRDVQAADFAIVLEMGAYLVLFLLHLALFLMFRSYKPNFYFSLFCLTWFFRMGTTGHSIFTVLIPGLDWNIKFRIEYATVAMITCLVLLILYEAFPGIVQNWARNINYIGLFSYIVLDVVLDTFTLSIVSIFYLGISCLTVIYIIVRFAMKLRHIRLDQAILLSGIVILMIVAIRDIVMYINRSFIPSSLYIEMTQVAVLACTLLAATAFFMATMKQVVDAREAEQRLSTENMALDRINRLKSELMVNLSHEIKTPLTVMSGYAQITAQQINSDSIDDETTENLEVISREAQRLSKLAGGILGTMNKNDRDNQVIEIPIIFQNIKRVCAPILKKNNNKMQIYTDENLPKLNANEEMIEQLLLNLITNANKNTMNGSIRMECRKSKVENKLGVDYGDEQLTISIIDDGNGIPDKLMPLIFERNVSGNDGTGVGLSICRDIVTLHDGNIDVKSVEGEGTQVTVTLPIDGKGGKNADDSND